MKTLLQLLSILFMTLSFTACGGGGGTNPDSNASDPSAQGSGIAVCIGDDQGYAGATVLSASNIVEGNSSNAKIRLWHSSTQKRACVVSGSVSKS